MQLRPMGLSVEKHGHGARLEGASPSENEVTRPQNLQWTVKSCGTPSNKKKFI